MPETKRPLKVFLCHAHDDKLKTRELYRYLRKRGIQSWLDAEDLVGGQDWRVEIPKAIKASDAIIICLSKNSINKEGFVQAEITFALEKALEIPQGRIFIIPARFEDCEVPDSLERYHWVDLFEEDGFPRLMKSLRTRAGQLERATVQVPQSNESSPNLNSLSEEKTVNEAAEKAALEKVEREAAEKAAREKAKKEVAEKAAREKAEREAAEKVEAVSTKELPQSTQDRILEAAIQKQVVIDKPASLYVWIKQNDSKSIISVVKSDVDEDVVLDESNVKSKGLEIEFPIEQGKVTNASVSLRLVAPEFSPSTQQKEVKVPLNGDSEVCTFLVTPKKVGRLLLNIEVLKNKVSVANRNLWTMAVGIETKESSPMLLVTIPIFVVVQSKQDVININGNVSDSVIVSGDHNAVNAEKARLESEELARQKVAQEKLEREAAEKAAREKVEKAAAEKARLEAEEQVRQKVAKEKVERDAAEKNAREKAEIKAAEKAEHETTEKVVTAFPTEKIAEFLKPYFKSRTAQLFWGVVLLISGLILLWYAILLHPLW